jgi:hypothetical protein
MKIRTSFPATAERLFGPAGRRFWDLLIPVERELARTEHRYHFLDLEAYQRLRESDPSEASRVHWVEMLQRAHWAAATSLMRHMRWFAASLSMFEDSNYPGFCAALRAMVESAGDSLESLLQVAPTLAQSRSEVLSRLDKTCPGELECPELERALLHFQWAQKLPREARRNKTERKAFSEAQREAYDAFHSTYGSKLVTDYVGGLGAAAEELYAELCAVVHPALESLSWLQLPSQDESLIVLGPGRDKSCISRLCRRHAEALRDTLIHGCNPGLLILKVLDTFPLEALRVGQIRSVNFSALPMWASVARDLERED